MPLCIEIHKAEGFLTCRYIGDVTDGELYDSWKAAYESPDWVPGMPELADLSELGHASVTLAGLQRLAEFCRATYERHGVSKVKVIVYAPQPAGYGIVRMYQAFSELSPEEVIVTKDLDQAKALAQQGTWPVVPSR
ncbi:MAG TPA: hypothetical protein VL137_05145 [Polyangiaceae bacterium]|nr:hypothetical protein [Polyangiaceae bacterium]